MVTAKHSRDNLPGSSSNKMTNCLIYTSLKLTSEN